jgi:epoxyqueuosine reductase QueG
MGRELRRVPLDYKGHGDPRNTYPDDFGEVCRSPEGEGYQLWMTTAADTPITPVFGTLRELAEYAADHCSTFADFIATADEWEAMLADRSGLGVHAREGNVIFL